MIKTYLYSFNKEDCAADKWDYGLLKEIFDKYNIQQIKVNALPIEDRAFVVIPGPQNIGHEKHIAKELQNISRLVLFITGDEEGVFDIDRINHPNAEIWIQYPHKKHEQYNKFPIGVPQHLKNNLPKNVNILLPIKVNRVSSSLPPLFRYLDPKTKLNPNITFLSIKFKYFGWKDPSALKIQTYLVFVLFIPSIIA